MPALLLSIIIQFEAHHVLTCKPNDVGLRLVISDSTEAGCCFSSCNYHHYYAHE